ncbi:MAG: DUF4440 domain-containing protein [Candidatus Magasanikbacteria bacterium]|nr:DUF4440 domain-containing protein [Candidatus Magasanikbacteria bacterium]|tara:strand:- start:5557 stop:5934 length:378 start_codon:yes stop_codon:yes gene_type:complete
MTKHITALFLEKEKKVWEALKNGDSNADAAQLTDDFLGVYPTGFSNKNQHRKMLDNGPIVAEYSLHNPKIRTLTEDMVLLCYLAHYTPITSGKIETKSSMYISSIWEKVDGVWKNSFSQDTPTKV